MASSEGNSICTTPISEPVVDPEPTSPYYAYDEITYDDLIIGGNSAPSEGINLGSTRDFTYNATSETYSTAFKFRWTAGNDPQFSLYFDYWGNYPFGVAVKGPNSGKGGGVTAGANGAWHVNPSVGGNIVQMSAPIVEGETYDIEFGRIKVKTGENSGKYNVYLKVDGELIKSYYVEATETLTNHILFVSSNSGNSISATPFVEEYETYDEIGFDDLFIGDESMAGRTMNNGDHTYSYNRTSPTYSLKFKYRWTAGGNALKFTTYLDDWVYPFCFAAKTPNQTGFGAQAGPNGAWHLVPSNSALMVNMEEPIVSGQAYDVEVGRLKVKNGANTGKYYVYFMIDGNLIQSYYYDGVSNGVYGENTALSNKIIISSPEGNAFGAIKESGVSEHQGVKCDFDGNGILNATDLAFLIKVLLRSQDTIETPEGMADFNNDGNANILDLIALKKHLAPVNTYAKSNSLVLGTQEHLLEDQTKTATYIADASATLGAGAYRLSIPIHNLYYATSTNGVNVRTDNMTQFKSMIAALKAKNINEILYVTDSFILPYGYSDASVNHNKTVPTPGTEDYFNWLKVNANAFAALAEEVPEIKFFEPFNEINVDGCRLEKYGIGWNATSQQQAAYSFTTAEKVGIMADLCWNISEAVKSVDPANQVTTPSIAVSQAAVVDNTFLDKFYDAIESGAYPSNRSLGDFRVDNFFTIINLHSYPDYSSNITSQLTDNWAARITTIYNVAKQHNDGGSRVWLTETGISSYEGGGSARNEEKAATILLNALNKINSDLTFIDTVFLYKVADISIDNGQTLSESGYGLFYSGDDLDHDHYAAKPSAKAVYRFLHNGSTDYSALTALAGRYDG